MEGAAGCAVCEAMLPDALEGTLTPAARSAFDKHVAGCVTCSRELDEAQRGAAWLALLKTQAPEPPAGLLAKILAETSGAATQPVMYAESAPALAQPKPRMTQHWGSHLAAARMKLSDAFRFNLANNIFQPRLAMTAAMAFFSLALTMNLAGVRLTDIRAANFTPSGLQRTFADLSASATRNFQNSRVVYQVESRVSDLRGPDAQ
jgi:hypothetical protein